MKKVIYIAKPLLATVLFSLALAFENASKERAIILMGIFIFYILWGMIRPSFHQKWAWIILLDGILIFLLEHYSKYLVNYFFHFLYVVVILEAGITLNSRRWGNTAAIFFSLLSMGKFSYALYVMPNAKTIAEFFFNFLALAFIVTLINYGKLQSEGRAQQEILYKELLRAYDKLKEYSQMREEALALKERNRIAGELHDSVGHSLTSLIMQIEMLDHLYQKNEDISDLLKDIKNNGRQALIGTREAVAALNEQPNKSIEDIISMLKSFQKDTNVEIDYNIPSVYLLPEEGIVLYRVLQEALTNALRHGKCSRIEVKCEVIKENFYFYIEDDGVGSNNKNGFGQRNMKERIESLGGSMEVITGRPYKIKGFFCLRRDEII
ncbi:sensor histidine kinase [Alkaliphilus sp. B6464]|uniref:sensor histidine kinase n=1 Tax=Alkaliphilus sp. B6464 TaxID=2731219 RepID=UPI001BA57D39|nr:sensor histidine kinase [Alkaliphilus sp. B6464]QUH19124.1 sensor histidine kinase [Alkaliphilus sp. B6464]